MCMDFRNQDDLRVGGMHAADPCITSALSLVPQQPGRIHQELIPHGHCSGFSVDFKLFERALHSTIANDFPSPALCSLDLFSQLMEKPRLCEPASIILGFFPGL